MVSRMKKDTREAGWQSYPPGAFFSDLMVADLLFSDQGVLQCVCWVYPTHSSKFPPLVKSRALRFLGRAGTFGFSFFWSISSRTDL
jgi:hypothetical protein